LSKATEGPLKPQRKGVKEIMKNLHMVTVTLVLVGALNWGLVALGFNLVTLLLGEGSMLTNLVYILIGVSAVYEIAIHKGSCKLCGKK